MREIEVWTTDGRVFFDTSLLSDEGKAKFIEGWKDAGGYMGDCESPLPWCMPWLRGNALVEAHRHNIGTYELGQVYWKDCKDEIASLLAQEQEALQEALQEV